ncbi:hypothetical protein AV654_08545 [Paenibacillus elgii]|uniref:Uncharacterized protein n=1 Tax=Paenibacillus elgii TaxID=189691 RepID=A0A163ZW40_9BACL|nr:hypothetical protein AV654_08545 [Paenibacillus elgii]
MPLVVEKPASLKILCIRRWGISLQPLLKPVNLIRNSGIFTGFKGGRKLLRDIPHLYLAQNFFRLGA